MPRRFAATAAAAFFMTAAFTANAQVLGPLADPRSAYDWSGFYLATQVGWGWADQHIEDAVSLDGEVGLNGGFFGPLIGFQKQWNRLVVGAEVEANWSDIDGQDSVPGAPGRTFGNVEIFGSAGLKVGYAWDRLLLYGTAGIAGAESGTLERDGAASTDDHAMSFGWMAGAGADFAVTQNIVVGVQYRHYDLGEADFELGFIPDRTGETDMDVVSGHVAFKLGGGP